MADRIHRIGRKVRIGNIPIGYGCKPYLLAEIGSNHNGNLTTAKKMIKIAADAGVDGVKFQVFSAETLYSENTPEFSVMRGQNVFQLIKSIEMPRDWVPILAEYCAECHIDFMATPFDFDAIDQISPYVPAFKFASFEITDLELIRYASKKGKPIIISTGMADLGDIESVLEAIRSVDPSIGIILLHCTSLYPTPATKVNLLAMDTLSYSFQIPVGYSDHTRGIHISLAAVARGACMIEKHFTLDRRTTGPDHAFAIEPDELILLASSIKDIFDSLGNGIKHRSGEEEEVYIKGRRSIHARVDIPSGTIITHDLIIVKRPGLGIDPRMISIVLGRKVIRDIKKDEWITWKDI